MGDFIRPERLLVALLLQFATPALAAPPLQNPPLVKEDLTRILYVLVNNAAAVRRKVDIQRATGTDVLRAALQVDQTDSFTRVRIERVLRFLPSLEQATAKVTVEEQAAIEEIAARLAASPTLTTRLALLEALDEETLPNGRYAKISGVNSGLLAASHFADDGLTTVYSVDWVYTALGDSPIRIQIHGQTTSEIGGGTRGDLLQVWSLVKRMFDAGVRGALVGAARYYAGRLPNTSPGECALAFAIGESARELIQQID